jgi:hypothetical protein
MESGMKSRTSRTEAQAIIACLSVFWAWDSTVYASATDATKGCQVDAVLDRIRSLNYEQRHSAYGELLKSLSQIEEVEDDYVAEYFFEKAGAIAVTTTDGAYLEALDEQRLDGGFANMVCMSYKEALRHRFAREAYAAKPGRKRHLVRCFESAEVDKLVLQGASAAEPTRIVPELRSCDIDKVLLNSRAQVADIHRLLERTKRLDPQNAWHLIGYLAFRLRENASLRSGQLMLREIAKMLSDPRPAPSLCQLMARGELEEPICRMLQRQRRLPAGCFGSAAEIEAETVERLKDCAAGRSDR